jgi:cytochrome c553
MRTRAEANEEAETEADQQRMQPTHYPGAFSSMTRISLIVLTFIASASFASAQIVSATTDVLGAHLNYGRGCAACHAPHSGAEGNGNTKTADSASGNSMLWGEDVSSLYGKTITTGGGKFVETLPTSMSATTPDVNGMLTCLSCHDGNYASSAMMKNQLYETLPPSYGTHNTVPTLLGNNSTGAGNYLNEHPTGLSAVIKCGGNGWDCSQSNGVVSMKGANSSRFVANYGFFVQPGSYNNNAVVVCTTCHNPHTMNVVTVTHGSNSGLPAGNYATMFFLRGPYNPRDTNSQSNQTAQFCRQCHGDLSNEMNGSTAGTVF